MIYIEENGEIAICPSCHDDVFQYGSRYDVDIMIVPVSEDSFKTATRKKRYVCPSRYIRKRPKFIAFYRGGDIGAITHVAKAVKIASKVPKLEVKAFWRSERLITPLWMDSDSFEVFNLKELMPLGYKITRNNAPPIQNRVYKTFKQFAKARKLEDLYISVNS